MRRKWKVWLIGIPGFLFLLLIALHIAAFLWINPIVDQILRESVSVYSDNLYEVTYDYLRVKPLERKLVLKNFHLSFDSSRVGEQIAFKKNIFVKASARNIELSIGDLEDLFFHRYLLVKKLRLHTPQLTVYNYADSTDRADSTAFNAYSLIQNYFDSMHVRQVDIREADFRMVNISGKPFKDFSLAHISASIQNLVIDSGTVYRNFGYPKADNFVLTVKDATYPLPESLYHASVGQITLYPMQDEIVLDDVRLTPQLDKEQLAQTVGHRKDWIKAHIAHVRLQQIDMHKLLVDNLVAVQNLTLDSANLHLYKDKRLKPLPRQKMPFIREALQQLPIAFCIDTLMVKNGLVLYEEQAPLAAALGTVSFDRIYASVYNTTNIDSIWQRCRLEADVEARLMETSRLQLSLDLPLSSRTGRHKLRGRIDMLPLPVMNSILEPVTSTSIKSGIGHSMEFEIEADDEKATGNVDFVYDDLKIALLNRQDPEDPKFKHKVGSVIANWFVIKADNPTRNQVLRAGPIYYVRNEKASVFNYWWRALLSGLKVSVGMEHEPEPELLTRTEEEPGDAPEEKEGFFKKIFKKNRKR